MQTVTDFAARLSKQCAEELAVESLEGPVLFHPPTLFKSRSR
jgi:hypothetical protein